MSHDVRYGFAIGATATLLLTAIGFVAGLFFATH